MAHVVTAFVIAAFLVGIKCLAMMYLFDRNTKTK